MNSPLVPAKVDLRDFGYMPLDVVRLRDAKIVSTVTGDEFRCAVLLWCASWHQVPAGSLPNDEQQLAEFAGVIGSSSPPRLRKMLMKEWAKLRTGAMHGWILCDDNRWYHPTIAEKALEAWGTRLEQRYRTELARIKKAAQRAQAEPVYPTFAQWEAHLIATGSEVWRPSTVPGDTNGDKDDPSPGRPPGNPIQGKVREGKGREIKEDTQGARDPEPPADPPADPPRDTPTEAGRACLLMRDAGCGLRTNPSNENLRAALREGVTPEVLADTVREGLACVPPIDDPFPWAIKVARNRHAKGAQPVTPGATHATASRPSAADRVLANNRAAEERERLAAQGG